MQLTLSTVQANQEQASLQSQLSFLSRPSQQSWLCYKPYLPTIPEHPGDSRKKSSPPRLPKELANLPGMVWAQKLHHPQQKLSPRTPIMVQQRTSHASLCCLTYRGLGQTSPPLCYQNCTVTPTWKHIVTVEITNYYTLSCNKTALRHKVITVNMETWDPYTL